MSGVGVLQQCKQPTQALIPPGKAKTHTRKAPAAGDVLAWPRDMSEKHHQTRADAWTSAPGLPANLETNHGFGVTWGWESKGSVVEKPCDWSLPGDAKPFQ